MTNQPRPTFLRRKLGAKLRRLREEAGMSLDEAAPQLDKKRSALHRLETGETRADVHIVRSMMDLYDKYDPALLDETREALKTPWYRAYGITGLGYVDIETEAAVVRQYLLVDVPGLLQTEPYMRALFTTGHSRSLRQFNNDVEVRRIRQRRLTSEERPLQLVAVVYEAALRHVVGDPTVMREQLCHLIEMAKLPTVTLQVVPLDGGARRLPNAPFNLVRFADPEDPEFLYVEYSTGSLHIEDAAEVQGAGVVFEQLRTDALNPADSVTLVNRLATELYGR